jgi:hypothetical protein
MVDRMSESESLPSPAPMDPGVSSETATVGPRRLRAIALAFAAMTVFLLAIAVVLVVT